ncbi:hypothetical protein AGMMS49928_19180 [Spirochaetia bacterium]|nr:hypothetical protein AGMMS49928_19180 [Spirochaetia bacterium]
MLLQAQSAKPEKNGSLKKEAVYTKVSWLMGLLEKNTSAFPGRPSGVRPKAVKDVHNPITVTG